MSTQSRSKTYSPQELAERALKGVVRVRKGEGDRFVGTVDFDRRGDTLEVAVFVRGDEAYSVDIRMNGRRTLTTSEILARQHDVRAKIRFDAIAVSTVAVGEIAFVPHPQVHIPSVEFAGDITSADARQEFRSVEEKALDPDRFVSPSAGFYSDVSGADESDFDMSDDAKERWICKTCFMVKSFSGECDCVA